MSPARTLRVLLALVLAGLPLLAGAEAPAKRITAWPLVYHASGETEAETDILWPLLRYERKDRYTRYALRPFLFSTEADPARDFRKTSVLWPLGIAEHTPERDWLHVFPFYWDIDARDYSVWQLWPLYGVYHRGATYTQHSIAWPLVTWGGDAATGDFRVDAPWPLIGYAREGARVSHRVLPLYAYAHGDGPGSGDSSGFVLPYFWSTAPDKTTRGLFPLWLSRDTPDHDTTFVLPFYLHDEQPGEEWTFITPLWAERETPESRLRVLLPLYAGYESPAFGIQVGLPLFGSYRSATTRFSAVLPVYFHSRNDARASEFTYWFPLYGSYRRGAAVSRHFLMFPLYSKLEDREQQLLAWDVLWPLFHYETAPDALDVRALPLYWRSRARDHDWTFAMLLYGAMESGGRERNWLLPFWFRTREGAWSLSLGSLALLPPYYLDHQAPDETHFHVWPFYGVDREGRYRERSFAWPLFRFGASDDGSYRLTQALAYYRAQRGAESSAGLLPLWYHASSPDRVVDGTLFLHWYQHEPPQARTHWAFLWLLPPDVSLVRYEHAPGFRRHGLFPLYGYERDDARDRLAWSALWPLFSYAAEGEVARESGFLWKVITYERKDAQTTDFRFLWRVVRSSEAPGASILEFNPFYYREREAGKGEYWNVLGGLVGKRTAEDGASEMQWLWFF